MRAALAACALLAALCAAGPAAALYTKDGPVQLLGPRSFR